MHAPLSAHVVAHLARSCHHGSPALAALHVALPVGSIIGLDAQFDPHAGTASWRGAHARFDAGRSDIAEQVHAFVAAEWRSGDLPVPTDGPVVRTVRSGAYHVAFGADLYLDRRMLIEPTFTDPAAVARSYIAAVEQRSPRDGSGVQTLGGVDCLVHDDGRTVLVSHVAAVGPRGADTHVDPWSSIDDVATELATAFGVDSFDVATLGSRADGTVDVDYVGTWTEQGRCYDLIVPATLGAGTVLGAPYGPAAPAVHDWYASGNRDPWYDLDAYEPLAASVIEPGWLARHRSSGIVVLLRAAD